MPAPRLFFEKEVCKEQKPATPKEYFAVKGGSNAGIYTTMAKAVQAKQDGGGALGVFTREADARAYAQQAQMFVVWAGRQVGVMDQQACIKATQRLQDAKMRGPMDEDAAKELWASLQAGAQQLSDAQPASNKSSKKKKRKQFYYAVAIGKVPGVYDTWKEAERQVKNVRPNLHSKFETKTKAQQFVDLYNNAKHSSASQSSDAASTTSAASATAATSDEPDGADESNAQGNADLQIETPSMEQLETAETEGKIRVYACQTGVGTARIALSFEEAIDGVKNPEVQVINSEDALLDNLAVAEVRLRTDTKGKRKSIADRLKAARMRAGAQSHATKASTTAAASPRAAASRGEYGSGMLVARSAVGRAKETQLIQYYFIDHPTPIKVVHGLGAPFPHELDDDMDLPNTKAIFNTTGQIKDLTITDFFRAKEKAVSSWPLMGFTEFMRICRKAQRMCQRSKKPNAVVNAAALDELMDICLSVHRRYERMNVLGQDEDRFKARMFLHIQHTVQTRVCYANAIAMTVFEDATDPFLTRLPGKSKSASPFSSSSKSFQPTDSQRKQDATPMSGCYLCPATDHFCNNRVFHPLVNGKHKPLSDAEKEAIIQRIESSTLSPTLKTAEKKRVRRYWSQHGL